MAVARFERQRARGDRAELFEWHPLGDRTESVECEPAPRRAVAQQTGRRDHAIPQAHAIQIDHGAGWGHYGTRRSRLSLLGEVRRRWQSRTSIQPRSRRRQFQISSTWPPISSIATWPKA